LTEIQCARGSKSQLKAESNDRVDHADRYTAGEDLCKHFHDVDLKNSKTIYKRFDIVSKTPLCGRRFAYLYLLNCCSAEK
jgi:hypothetical protein